MRIQGGTKMIKRLALILCLAFCIGLIAVGAEAAVQNIRVSGDLTTYALSRNGFFLQKDANWIKPEGIIGIVRLRVDADLTDNVSATVGLLNERIWSTKEEAPFGVYGFMMDPETLLANNTTEIVLDLAYVTLRDFLDSPLTLIIGRQNLVLGSGLLIADPWTNQFTSPSSPLFWSGVDDLSARKSFDAIVGIYDLDPLIVTLGMAKCVEGVSNMFFAMGDSGLSAAWDDINHYLVSLDYDFGDDMETTGQLYYVRQQQNRGRKVNNVGVRLATSLTEDLSVSGEVAYQRQSNSITDIWGNDLGNRRSNMAWLVDASFAIPDVEMSPVVSVDYMRLGKGWDPMAEGITPAAIANAIIANTNLQVIGTTLTLVPTEDITASLRYANLRLVDAGGLGTLDFLGISSSSIRSGKKNLGNEINVGLTYDYTEDVRFGLDLGYLCTGNAIEDRKDATQVIGSMKVSF